jgi:hypothetical protein
LLGLFVEPEDEGDVSPKRGWTFNGLHGVVSKETVLFITTGVKNSNPTKTICFQNVSSHIKPRCPNKSQKVK